MLLRVPAGVYVYDCHIKQVKSSRDYAYVVCNPLDDIYNQIQPLKFYFYTSSPSISPSVRFIPINIQQIQFQPNIFQPPSNNLNSSLQLQSQKPNLIQPALTQQNNSQQNITQINYSQQNRNNYLNKQISQPQNNNQQIQSQLNNQNQTNNQNNINIPLTQQNNSQQNKTQTNYSQQNRNNYLNTQKSQKSQIQSQNNQQNQTNQNNDDISLTQQNNSQQNITQINNSQQNKNITQNKLNTQQIQSQNNKQNQTNIQNFDDISFFISDQSQTSVYFKKLIEILQAPPKSLKAFKQNHQFDSIPNIGTVGAEVLQMYFGSVEELCECMFGDSEKWKRFAIEQKETAKSVLKTFQ
ncbi:Hypothetical_protein [Hexamita inflata]|uniref:Hypothetical_protein n=1 Tax=Hexamita inflata TaxID=28002 RepID=A0AA86TZV9_9EUKA|nr:Hypothetical protein HINF_LOCUS20882 [Hexamita inflata]